ncbi:MAG TPA: hypothetical protein DEF42_07140 [Desulfosporosinus sp.]|nr:hypothetical protein [Desulfosporosinus sp.]
MLSNLILKRALKLPSPDCYYLGLLEIPYHFINKRSKVEEKYDLIEQHILSSDIAKQIAALVSQETRISVLDDLFFGCKRYRIKSCKDAALQMCRIKTIAAYNRRNALEYLLNLFGPNLILEEVMPSADDSFFEIIVDLLRAEGDERLKAEMLYRYERSPSHFLLKNLILLNVPAGPRAYIDACREVGGIMDCADGVGEITEAISAIQDINLLPLLLDLVRLRFSDAFIVGSFHSLYGSLLKALTVCAKSNFELVWRSIDELKTELSSNLDAISFCNVLQNDMLESNKMSLVKELTIPEVKAILRTVE